MTRHTDREYARELDLLRERVLLMGSKVEAMVGDAMQAFHERDTQLARATLRADHEVDQLELEIDERCLKLLARRQPVASDLRFITTSLKLVTDLERVGDLATNICERTLELSLEPPVAIDPRLPRMAQLAQEMLADALNSFVQSDAQRARAVVERDALVDAAYAETFPALTQRMVTEPDAAQRLLSVGRYLERVADHATNIAEMVVFMVEGKDVRHTFHAVRPMDS
ncbi:MAG: phosphate signaling complex protein PhoU [Polyangiaceae bacterium]|nr:phosphate signaling complex protein PhoU [Polyangiaceae bacterium]